MNRDTIERLLEERRELRLRLRELRDFVQDVFSDSPDLVYRWKRSKGRMSIVSRIQGLIDHWARGIREGRL